MKQFCVDLYEYYGQIRPEGATGTLKCYILDTAPSATFHRVHPAVLVIPGGGYSHVSRREGEPVALRFLTRGWCAFVLDYSIFPLRFPVALREAAMAMCYIRQNAAALCVDPEMVAAMGFSAGGHLCGCLGTLYDAPEVGELGPGELIRPDALGLCYPVALSWGRTHGGSFDCLCSEDAVLRQRLSLDRLVRPDMPPVFLWHTRDDGTVPCRNCLVLAERLDDLGVDLSLHIYRTGTHGLSTADSQSHPVGLVPQASWDVPSWLEAMVRFFEELGFHETDGGAEQ